MFSRFGIQLITTIVLARLLLPEDFGVIALLSLFVSIAGAFIDSGFSASLIQKNNFTEQDASSVFYFNVGLGIVMAVILSISAPFFVNFFQLPILRWLTYILALNLLVGAFGAVHLVFLNKNLDFRTQMRINITATIMSGAAAILMAWYGWGVWSLAFQILIASVVRVLLIWFYCPWRPSLTFSAKSLSALFNFGGFVFLTNLLEAIYGRLHTLLIGKLYSPVELGLYARAENTQNLATSILTETVNRVAFPIFSQTKLDKIKLKRGVRKALAGTMLVNAPVVLGLLAVSEPLVSTLFGENWLPSVPYLQVLCLVGLIWPLNRINLSVLVAQGYSKLFFRLELIKKFFGIFALILVSSYGVLAIAWSQVAVAFIAYLVNTYFTRVHLDYSALKQLRDVMPYFLASGIMLLVLTLVSISLSSTNPAILLVIQIALAIIVYGSLCHVLRLSAYVEALTQLNVKLKKLLT